MTLREEIKRYVIGLKERSERGWPDQTDEYIRIIANIFADQLEKLDNHQEDFVAWGDIQALIDELRGKSE